MKKKGKEHGTLIVVVNDDGSTEEVVDLDDDVEGEDEGEEESDEEEDTGLPMQSRLTLKQKIAVLYYYHANGKKNKSTCRWIVATYKRSSVSHYSLLFSLAALQYTFN